MIRSLPLIALLLVSSCTGITARNEALLPAMNLVWVRVLPQVEAGIAISEVDASIKASYQGQADAMTQALASGKRQDLISIDWYLLRSLAEGHIRKRISDGEIGPGVAASLVERLDRFQEALVLVNSR